MEAGIINVPKFEDQSSRIGRPCSVCTHAHRSEVEASLLDGESLSSVAATYTVTRQALRRHRAAHMNAGDLRDAGIGAYAIAVRLFETADRLRDLADDAEQMGRFADATRATLAEARTLDFLLNLGAKGGDDLKYAKDAVALEGAVAALVRQVPAIGDQIAKQLEQQDRSAYAAKFRDYAEKCLQLPEHQAKPQQVSGNERQELSHADI